MSYQGTTAASSLSNPPIKLFDGFLGRGANTTQISSGLITDKSADGAGLGARSMWWYASSAGSTEVFNANYFTDAQKLGMRQGDLILCSGNTGSSNYVILGVLSSVTTNGAALASSGAFLSSTR